MVRPLENTLIKLIKSLDFYQDEGRKKIAIGRVLMILASYCQLDILARVESMRLKYAISMLRTDICRICALSWYALYVLHSGSNFVLTIGKYGLFAIVATWGFGSLGS